MTVIASWMYSSPPGDKTYHPQVGMDCDSQEIQNRYWRCVFALFESSARLNKDCRHLLFLNKRPPAVIDHVQTEQLIDAYDLHLHEFDRVSRPPADFYEAWNTQFIVIDAIEVLAEYVDEDEFAILLDADCFFNKPISNGFEEAVRKHRALLYTIDYPLDYNINGLNRKELIQLCRDYDAGLMLDEFKYAGGEFFCVMGSEIRLIAEVAREAYEISLDKHRKGLSKFNEEAQLLSYVYAKRGYKSHTANPYIKRIWTDRRFFRNVDGKEDDLIIWHLPAEKNRGFRKVFESINLTPPYYVEPQDFQRTFRIKETFYDQLREKFFG